MIRPPDNRLDKTRCRPLLLSKLAQDEVNDLQSAWLADHLDRCDQCREKLELLSTPVETWHETRAILIAETKRTSYMPTDARMLGSASASSVRTQESPVSPSLVRWLEPIGDATGIPDRCIGSLDGYPVRRILGVGGMGVVLDAWDPSLCRTIAIKAMHPHLAANGTAKQRFVREARSAAAVLHPNVVAIHSVNAEHDPPYLIMPLIAGESLQARVDRDGPLEMDAALRVAAQIADGLSAAHAQGLIHRDIKPANILLEHGTERALLTDFGVVRALNDATMTASGVIAGTPEYMSPEQAAGKNLSARSDLFSLGSVCYTMLVGHPPFRAETALAVLRRIEQDKARPLSEHRADVADTIQILTDWMLEKDPDQRIESASQLANVCRSLLAHRLDPKRIPPPDALKKRVVSKHEHSKAPYRLATILSLVVVAVVCFLAGRLLPKGSPASNAGTPSSSAAQNNASSPTPDPTSTPDPTLIPVPLTTESPSSDAKLPSVLRGEELLDREFERIETWVEALEKDLARPTDKDNR